MKQQVKLNWTFGQTIVFVLMNILYGILTAISFGFAGHLQYNYSARKVLEYTNLRELGIDHEYRLSWKIICSVFGYLFLLVLSLLKS